MNKLGRKALPYRRIPANLYGRNDGLSYYFATTVVIIDIGKNHQWLQKLVGEGFLKTLFT